MRPVSPSPGASTRDRAVCCSRPSRAGECEELSPGSIAATNTIRADSRGVQCSRSMCLGARAFRVIDQRIRLGEPGEGGEVFDPHLPAAYLDTMPRQLGEVARQVLG